MDLMWWVTAIVSGFIGSVLCFIVVKVSEKYFPSIFEKIAEIIKSKRKDYELDIVQLSKNEILREKCRSEVNKLYYDSTIFLLYSMLLMTNCFIFVTFAMIVKTFSMFFLMGAILVSTVISSYFFYKFSFYQIRAAYLDRKLSDGIDKLLEKELSVF